MSLTSLSCPPPIRRLTRDHKPDFALFEEAVELHEQGHHRASVDRVFDHLFSREHPGRIADGITFEQGSSLVEVRLTGEELHIVVPMVCLSPKGKTTAALRFLLTRLGGSGQLYQPRLRGEEVTLEFHDKLTRLHPAKLVEVLRRMPTAADANDDWMVDQFSVDPLRRVAIEALEEGEFARAEALWRTHWGEVDALLTECRRKRSLSFLNELTAYAYYHVAYALPLGGYLHARISESMSTFNDSQADPDQRESTLARCAREMSAVSREDLARSLGHARFAISPLAEGTSGALKNYLGPGDYTEAIRKARVTGRALDAALALVGTYAFLLARFSWPEEIEGALLEGLTLADGKPLREAASQLWVHSRALISRFGKDEEEGAEGEADSPPEEPGEAAASAAPGSVEVQP
jgi:hypothetical protein